MRLRRWGSCCGCVRAARSDARALLLALAGAAGHARGRGVIGGIAFSIGGVRVRAHSSALRASLRSCSARSHSHAAASSCARRRAGGGKSSNVPRAPIACAIAIAPVAVGWGWGTHVAGGSDSYCYLNEAELLAGGRVRELQPIAAGPPWPESGMDVRARGPRARTGTRGRDRADLPGRIPTDHGRGASSCRARRMFCGRPAVLGGLAVWLVFVLARRLGWAPAGLTAAVLLACEPRFPLSGRAADERCSGSCALACGAVLTWRADRRRGTGASICREWRRGWRPLSSVRPNLVPSPVC